MQDNLNDLQVAKIEAFCADNEMREAVKRVLLAGIYEHGTVQAGFTPDPLQNAAFNLASLSMENPIPDEVLGAHVRGMWAGINALHNAFKRLESIKSTKAEEVESPYNIAE